MSINLYGKYCVTLPFKIINFMPTADLICRKFKYIAKNLLCDGFGNRCHHSVHTKGIEKGI